VLYNKAKENAKSILQEAEEKINKSRDMLDENGMAETQSLLLKGRNMLESDSYFNYLDVIACGNYIISICNNRLNDLKKHISERFYQMNGQIEKYMKFIKRYRYQRFIAAYRKELVQARQKIDHAQKYIKLAPGEQIDEFETFCESLSSELNNIGSYFKRLDILQQFLINFFNFLKNAAVFLSIALLIGIFVIPVIMPAIIKIDVAGDNEIWPYQKTFLIIGSVTSLCISLFMTIKKIIHDD